jgi:ABC-type uncharacterized transport system permease subunit
MDAKEDSKVIDTTQLLDELSAALPLLVRDEKGIIRPWIQVRQAERLVALVCWTRSSL